MGIFDKLKFWKKEDDFDFEKIEKEINQGSLAPKDDLGLGQSPSGLEEKSIFEEEQKDISGQKPAFEDPALTPPATGFQQARQQRAMATPAFSNRDLELINSKLDTIKAILNSLDQRVANLERTAGVGKKQERLW